MTAGEARDVAIRYLRELIDWQRYPVRESGASTHSLDRLLELAVRCGARIHEASGPWRVKLNKAARAGRRGADSIPVVKGRAAEIRTETLGQAVCLAGFLNWCAVPDPPS